jgi:hypothetical protein
MKKLISFVVCVSLLFSQPAQANFFTDLFGGLFTVVSYPFQLILGSPKAPFFVAQNPFVEKEWHKEERVAAGRKAADNAQPEGQNTPNLEAASPTPAPSPSTKSTKTSGKDRDKDKGAARFAAAIAKLSEFLNDEKVQPIVFGVLIVCLATAMVFAFRYAGLDTTNLR